MLQLALLHSFSGPVDYGERALDMGLAISFSGLAFRKGEELYGKGRGGIVNTCGSRVPQLMGM